MRCPPGWQSRASSGCEIGWIAHQVPSHLPANKAAVLAFVVKPATTVQAVAAVHDKPSICMAFAPWGLGIRRLIHTPPVHRAANGTDWLRLRVNVPIPVHRPIDEHEI